MTQDKKKTFLTVYDYGQGGVWFLMDARSKAEVEALDRDFRAFEDRPEWMSPEQKVEYVSKCEKKRYHWDIDSEPTGWLADFFSNRHVENKTRKFI